MAVAPVLGIGDFVPDDGSQIVEADLPAALLDRGMQRDNGMPTLVLPSGEAYVPDHHNKSSPRNEAAIALFPDRVQFGEKPGVIRFMPKLALSVRISFENPIRRRGEDEVQAFLRRKGIRNRVPQVEVMESR